MMIDRRFILFCIAFISLLSCKEGAETVKQVYLRIDNPRNLGDVGYAYIANGKITGFSNSAQPGTTTTHNYLCAISVFGIKLGGIIERVEFYLANKGGVADAIQFEKDSKAGEKGIAPGSYVAINLSDEFTDYIFILRSISEETGVRIFRISKNDILASSALNPIRVPDLRTIPKLADDAGSKRLLELYEPLAKYTP